MADHHFLTFFILLLPHITGSRAGDTVYVQTGASVQLSIQRDQLPDEFKEFIWMNDKGQHLLKYITASKRVKLNPSYEDRVDFNTETFSLTLKNIQKTDSGLYIAGTDGLTRTVIAEHRLSVIGHETSTPPNKRSTSTHQSYIVIIIVIVVVVAGVIVFCGLVFHCCCSNKKENKGVQQDGIMDYYDIEFFKTLAQIHEVTDETWTTVTYHTVKQHHRP